MFGGMKYKFDPKVGISEFASANEWRQVQNERTPSTSDFAIEVWSRGWLQGWSRAKRVAEVVEVEAQQFGRSWADVWTLAEAKWSVEVNAWVRAKAEEWAKERAKGRGRIADANAIGQAAWANTQVESLTLAGVWAWARKARAHGEAVPSELADSSTIWHILSELNREWVTRDFWRKSQEAGDEYSCIIHFIAPIARLPLELLRQIFLIIIDETSGSPLVLMRVCRQWHAIVTSLWASLNLGTRTPMDAVITSLKRNQCLDIVVDTDSDCGGFTPTDGIFDAIFAAIEASPRWRSLVVKSFPARADLPEDLVNRPLHQQISNAPMSRFTTFKINSACETSPLLDRLLRAVGTTARALTTVEINSANVIAFLAPLYPSIFTSVTQFRGLSGPTKHSQFTP